MDRDHWDTSWTDAQQKWAENVKLVDSIEDLESLSGLFEAAIKVLDWWYREHEGRNAVLADIMDCSPTSNADAGSWFIDVCDGEHDRY